MFRPFLRVFGRLHVDGTYHPLPGWETTRLARRCRPAADLSLKVLDAKGSVVGEGSVERRPVRCNPATLHSEDAESITGHVLLHPYTTALELACDGQVIHRVSVSPEKPKIRSLRVIPGEHESRVHWEVEHSSPLTFNLVFLDPLSRLIPIAQHLAQTSFDIDLRRLPGGGECRVGLLATDGVRSEVARSDPFTLPARPPELCFQAPLPEAVLSPDQPFSLQGFAHDLAGQALPDTGIVWSIDGIAVARGTRLAASEPLASGKHEIAMEYVVNTGETLAVAKRTVSVPARSAESQAWLRVRASLPH